MLNLLSLVFGIAAWVLAFCAMARNKMGMYIGASFFCCSVSLAGQLLEINQRALRGDFGGVEDTIGVVIVASSVLLVGTVILNLIAVWFAYTRNKKGCGL